MFVLDTNVVSEVMRPKPEPKVIAWLDAKDPTDLLLSAIAVAEIRVGIALLDESDRREQLQTLFASFIDRGFAGRVLPFDEHAAWCYGEIVAGRRRAGRPIAQLDAQIAAIAQVNGCAVVTRNARDFDLCGVRIVNPWS